MVNKLCLRKGRDRGREEGGLGGSPLVDFSDGWPINQIPV